MNMAQQASMPLSSTWRVLEGFLAAARTSIPREVCQRLSVPHTQAPAAGRAALKLLWTENQSSEELSRSTDELVLARILSSVRPSTLEAYSSALRLIFLFCSILNQDMIPTSAPTVWKLAAIINNANSLKVYLAAWRKAHILMGARWPCESCAVLRDIKRGIRNLMPPRFQWRWPHRQRRISVWKNCEQRLLPAKK